MKRMVALSLVLLLSIENFAAVVSDNDGSAFITKAEFDSLKNDFQSQIDYYNTSIDNKIDGAIASYLAGIQIAETTRESVIFSDWKAVSSMNYVLENIYQPLEFRGIYENKKFVTNQDYTYWKSCAWSYANTNIGRSTGKKQKIKLVDAGDEGATISKNYVLWKGYTVDYKDELTISLSTKKESSVSATGGDWLYNTGKQYFCYMGKFICPGYVPDLNTAAATIWQPSVYSTCAATPGYQSGQDSVIMSATTRVKLEKDQDGNTCNYEHIIHYGLFNNLICADNNWLNTLNASGALKGTNFTKFTNAGRWGGINGSTNKNQSEVRGPEAYSGFYLGPYNSDIYDADIPTVGLINKNFKSNELYQFDKDLKAVYGHTELTLEPLSLTQGFALLGAEENADITWKPKFKNIVDDNGNTLTSRINVQFSKKPFNGTTTSSDAIVPVSVNGLPQMGINAIEPSSDAKFEWTMPETGFIYMIWWPEDTDINNLNWSIDLDLANCNIFEKKIVK